MEIFLVWPQYNPRRMSLLSCRRALWGPLGTQKRAFWSRPIHKYILSRTQPSTTVTTVKYKFLIFNEEIKFGLRTLVFLVFDRYFCSQMRSLFHKFKSPRGTPFALKFLLLHKNCWNSCLALRAWYLHKMFWRSGRGAN